MGSKNSKACKKCHHKHHGSFICNYIAPYEVACPTCHHIVNIDGPIYKYLEYKYPRCGHIKKGLGFDCSYCHDIHQNYIHDYIKYKKEHACICTQCNCDNCEK